MKEKIKLIVLIGPTATGKSDCAVEIAQKFNGEIISADSRQVYKGMDIGTGKITKEEMKKIPHHLLDVVSPNQVFNVLDWKNSAEKIIEDISKRGKLPIICGGTGFYVDVLIDGLEFPTVPVDHEEQDKLELKSAEELFGELKALDPIRAESIDSKNKRRLSRAIMIARELGFVPPVKTITPEDSKYQPLRIGLTLSDDELRTRIETRLTQRLDNGMLEEAQRLNNEGVSFERMRDLGLEYRYEADFLEKKLTREEFVKILSTKIWQFAKRQKTWWKKNSNITWFKPTERKEIISLVEKFLKN